MTLCLTSCKGDSYSRELIVEKLYLPYTAEADFIFSDGENNSQGKASIVKSDITTLTFLEPEAYSGISVKSDATGNEDIFSFELSGIPATVPKSIAGDLSLMFSLFTDIIPQKIDTLEKDSFSLSGKVNDAGNELVEVFFTENNLSYRICYDRRSGIPYSFDAGNEKVSASIVINNFEPTNIQE